MRTYDKLIATISDRRNTRYLCSCFGRVVAAHAGSCAASSNTSG